MTVVLPFLYCGFTIPRLLVEPFALHIAADTSRYSLDVLDLDSARLELDHLGVGVQRGARRRAPGAGQLRVPPASRHVVGLVQLKVAVGQQAAAAHRQREARRVRRAVGDAADQHKRT